MSPSKKNNALTSLVQARLGQALFFLLVLRTMAEGKVCNPTFRKVSIKPFQRLAGSKGGALVAIRRWRNSEN